MNKLSNNDYTLFNFYEDKFILKFVYELSCDELDFKLDDS